MQKYYLFLKINFVAITHSVPRITRIILKIATFSPNQSYDDYLSHYATK